MSTALISAVGTGGAGTGSTLGGTSAPIDTTGANLIVIWTSCYGEAPTIGDNKGNAYLSLTQSVFGSFLGQFFYSLNPIVGSGHTFSCTATGEIYPSWIVYAFDNTKSYQMEGIGSAPSGMPVACTSVSPSGDGALIVTGIATYNSPLGAVTDTALPGFATATTMAYVEGSQLQASMAWQQQATAAPIVPAWYSSPDAHQSIAVACAVFLPLVVAAPPSVQMGMII